MTEATLRVVAVGSCRADLTVFFMRVSRTRSVQGFVSQLTGELFSAVWRTVVRVVTEGVNL